MEPHNGVVAVDRGHVRLWRKIIDSPVWKNEGLLKVWIWCMTQAVEEPQVVEVNLGRGKKTTTLESGQFTFSRAIAAEQLGMPPSTVRNHIHALQQMKQLDKLGQTALDKRITVLSITNWKTYNEGVSSNGHTRTNCAGHTKAGKKEPVEPKQSSPVVLMFPTTGAGPKQWALTKDKLDEYQTTYPDLDVMAECRKALQWLNDNTSRRKTATGMTKFLGGWLMRTQNRGKGRSAKEDRQGEMFGVLPDF